jgi:acyl transferase domain-containing protein
MELQTRFTAEGKSARQLGVDQPYHSPFIAGCSSHYLPGLKSSQIQYRPASRSTWISTVHRHPVDMSSDPLGDTYWLDNLLNPVLLKEAVEQAIHNHGPFSIALEVGPHVALRALVTQTINYLIGQTIPYHGTLARRQDDVAAFTEALAFLWTHDKTNCTDLHSFWKAVPDDHVQMPSVIKNLPTQPWDHDQSYWNESRTSREYRLHSQPFEPLLGTRKKLPDGQIQWRNILRSSHIPWIKGHVIQGEVFFPAACYCYMALEAATSSLEGGQPRMVSHIIRDSTTILEHMMEESMLERLYSESIGLDTVSHLLA